jgi:hypothetical protein
MIKNFAGQPAGGGQIDILTGRELLTDIAPATPEGFQRRTLFVDNCQNCDSPNKQIKRNFMFKNETGLDADWDYFLDMPLYPPSTPTTTTAPAQTTTAPKTSSGGFLSGINFGDVFKTAGNVYTTTQQRKTAQEQGQYALEIEKQRAAQERAKQEAEYAKAQAAMSQSGSAASKIKAYTVPLLIGGVVIIGGIAAYFYFKKKKVS